MAALRTVRSSRNSRLSLLRKDVFRLGLLEVNRAMLNLLKGLEFRQNRYISHIPTLGQSLEMSKNFNQILQNN
jgi:hypothetical protein